MSDADRPEDSTDVRPPDVVPGADAQPSNRPLDEESISEVLEEEDGSTYRVEQQPTGAENAEGGGEWPSPHSPPRGPSPG